MIYLFLGTNGVGKTSLAVAFGIRAMDNGKQQVEVAQQNLADFPGYSKVKIPQNHLVYSDIYMCGSEIFIKPQKAHFSTGYRFGLPNSDFETDYFPYGSWLIFDEARKYWNARKSMKSYKDGGIHEKTYEAFELHRHNGLNIILVTQLDTHIDKNIRELAHVVICPYAIRQEKRGSKLKKIVTIWNYYKFNSIKDYIKYNDGDKSIIPENCEFIFNGNIFDCYDSEFFKFKFVVGLRKYSNAILKPCDGTKKSVMKLNELFSDMRVIGSKIKKEKKEVQDALSEYRRLDYEYL